MDDIIRIPPPSRILMCKCGELILYIDEFENYSGTMPRCKLCNSPTHIPDMSAITIKSPQEVMERLEADRERLRKAAETEAKAEEERKQQDIRDRQARQKKLKEMTAKILEQQDKAAEGKPPKKSENISEEEILWQSKFNDKPQGPKGKKPSPRRQPSNLALIKA